MVQVLGYVPRGTALVEGTGFKYTPLTGLIECPRTRKRCSSRVEHIPESRFADCIDSQRIGMICCVSLWPLCCTLTHGGCAG